MPARLRIVDFELPQESFREAVIRGLSTHPKSIPSKFLYDEKGSELFDMITRQPEYYQTRTELALIDTYGDEIAAHFGPKALLVEYGSGNNKKIRRLLQSCSELEAYVPVDISRDYLIKNAKALVRELPDLEVIALSADILQPFSLPPTHANKQVIYFPGSTLGNFEPATMRRLLQSIHQMIRPKGMFLVGLDLKKDPMVLHRAYNDALGYTAQFELNLLTRMQRELGAQLDREAFFYEGFYNQSQSRVEMYVTTRSEQTIRIEEHAFTLEAGERIHLENSYKFEVESFADFAAPIGFRFVQAWQDDRKYFALVLLEAL